MRKETCNPRFSKDPGRVVNVLVQIRVERSVVDESCIIIKEKPPCIVERKRPQELVNISPWHFSPFSCLSTNIRAPSRLHFRNKGEVLSTLIFLYLHIYLA